MAELRELLRPYTFAVAPPRTEPGTPLIERLALRIDYPGNDVDCWPWRGSLGAGHGQINIGGRHTYVHRVVYELLVGSIPEGMTIDHMCHNRDETCNAGIHCPHRRCVNPAHLEPATMRDNVMRGRGFGAVHARQTHCPAGHEYDAVYCGARECRRCNLRNQRAWAARQKAKETARVIG